MADSLVAAKQEYTNQLCDILTPLLYKGFKSIWKHCRSNGKNSLKSFQEKLTTVPIWNQDVIDNEYSRIVKETDCNWLDKLIEAVFLSNVKVLSTIRIGKVKTIDITVPETKKFIHHCYIEGARRLWQDPYLIDDREDNLSYTELKRNEKRMCVTLDDAIEKTISKLIPIQNILESYLTDIEGSGELEIEPEPFEDEEIEPTEPIENNDDDNVQEIQEKTVNYTPSTSDDYQQDQPKNDENEDIENSDVFMKEPVISENDTTNNNYGNSNEDINLNVTSGTTVEQASTHFNNQPEIQSRDVKISNSGEQETPFFSDSDEEA